MSSHPTPAGGPTSGFWDRLKRTGEGSPGTLAVIVASGLLWAALSALTLGALILDGHLSATIGLVAVAMLCTTLPALFDPRHGRVAAILRMTGLLLAVLALAAVTASL